MFLGKLAVLREPALTIFQLLLCPFHGSRVDAHKATNKRHWGGSASSNEEGTQTFLSKGAESFGLQNATTAREDSAEKMTRRPKIARFWLKDKWIRGPDLIRHRMLLGTGAAII